MRSTAKKRAMLVFFGATNEQVERGKRENDLARQLDGERARGRERVSRGCYLHGYFSILFSIFLSGVPILLTLKRTQRSQPPGGGSILE